MEEARRGFTGAETNNKSSDSRPDRAIFGAQFVALASANLCARGLSQ